jgi:carbon-monoxide dehydrogenase medium subunit
VAVAASLHQGRVSVVVGAVAERPQRFPDLCVTWKPADGASAGEIAAGYADRIDPVGDNRGSAAYRTRMIAVEVRRALDTLAPAALTAQAAGR